jgi:pyruvate/2-oxoglutarate/acetoin dehydrogenase E1 component
MEHKELWAVTGEVDETAAPTLIGRAAVRRQGSDVTIVYLVKHGIDMCRRCG